LALAVRLQPGLADPVVGPRQLRPAGGHLRIGLDFGICAGLGQSWQQAGKRREGEGG
jgi:hypothetical protein